MGRLIDADALIEEIRNGDKVASFNYFLSLVQAQPTAYDISKVVAELDKQAKQYNRRALELVDKSPVAGIHNKGKAYSYEHAIDIVRRGGVE